MARIHVRYKGESIDRDLEEFGLTLQSSENEIKRALSAYLDESVDSFRNLEVEVSQTRQSITVKPAASYGR